MALCKTYLKKTVNQQRPLKRWWEPEAQGLKVKEEKKKDIMNEI